MTANYIITFLSELKIHSITNNINNETTIFIQSAIIALILSLIIYTAGYSLTNNHKTDLNKISAYECGYSPNSHESIQYNANFIIICLLFLLIDLEILFLVPFLYSIDSINHTVWNIFLYVMIGIIAGVTFELLTNSFDRLGRNRPSSEIKNKTAFFFVSFLHPQENDLIAKISHLKNAETLENRLAQLKLNTKAYEASINDSTTELTACTNNPIKLQIQLVDPIPTSFTKKLFSNIRAKERFLYDISENTNELSPRIRVFKPCLKKGLLNQPNEIRNKFHDYQYIKDTIDLGDQYLKRPMEIFLKPFSELPNFQTKYFSRVGYFNRNLTPGKTGGSTGVTEPLHRTIKAKILYCDPKFTTTEFLNYGANEKILEKSYRYNDLLLQTHPMYSILQHKEYSLINLHIYPLNSLDSYLHIIHSKLLIGLIARDLDNMNSLYYNISNFYF